MATDHQITEENRRVAIVTAAQAMLAQGESQAAIAAALGVNPATLSRYLQLVRIGGLGALRPATTNAGRRPLVRMTPDEVTGIQKMALRMDPHDPKKTTQYSASLSARLFARTPECRPELADAILKARSSKHTLTPTIRRQLRLTKSSRLLNAGPDAFNLGGIVTPRDLTFVDFDGAEKPIFPGVLFESDDMTANEPCWVQWDDPADPCAAKYGCRLARPQTLFWLDVGSGRFVGYSTVLRYNDAYRASDILWSVSHLFHSVGAPKFLRLEYGVWDAGIINRLDSVHNICHIHRATSAKTKFIENRFNHLQKYLALVGLSLGRFRGVKEDENDKWFRAREARGDPREHFPSLETWTAKVDAALVAFNSEPVEGEVYGPANAMRFHNRRAWVPDELWALHTASHPMKKPTVEESYRLLPTQAEVSVRGGHVQVKSAEHGAVFYFYHDAFARLGDGYKVTVCCDLAQPEIGAAILNREVGARSAYAPGEGETASNDGAESGSEISKFSTESRQRPYRAQELICVAEAVDRVPQFSATREWDDRESFERRKRYREQCRLQYRAIMPFGRGQGTAAKVTEHRDGRGNVAVAEAGTPRSSGLITQQPAGGAGDRPASPALVERAARQGTRELVAAARATLTADDIIAACAAEANDTEPAGAPAPTLSEITALLRDD